MNNFDSVIKNMDEFPAFMKNSKNHIDSSQQHTKDIDGYYFEGKDGSQIAYWTYYADRTSEPHSHDFDEYTVCISGQYTAIIDGKEFVLNPGDELFVPKGTLESCKAISGTRTMHAFGGKRITQENL